MIENTQIGKITDAGTLVSGGRVDQYWAENSLSFDFNMSDNNKRHNNIYNINPNVAIEQFGFKSMEFGNWLNQSERAFFLYSSTVSFSHLSNIFNIPQNLVGFDGKLSIAFGARGSGGALAHFERLDNIIINLTKDGGHHSLAHEYGHAIDNLIGFYVNGTDSDYLTGGRSNRTEVDIDKLLSSNYFVRQMEQLIKELYFNKDGSETEFLTHIKAHPKANYLTKRTEVFARTFEVYINNKLVKAGIDNEFLTKKEKFKKHYPILNKKSTRILDAIVNNAFKVFSGESKAVKAARVQPKNEDILQLGAVEVLSQNGKGLDFNGYNPTYKILNSYDHLIKGSNSPSTSKIIAKGGLNETIEVIKSVITNYEKQLAPLANHLKADTLTQSTFNIWHFIKKNIRYDFDLAGVEEIRTPARTWKDRFKRSDCEDYAIFASSLLINMGYTPTLRIVAFNNKDYFQHIYVVINGITIDAVLDKYNKEPENITNIMDIKLLSGLGAIEEGNEIVKKLMNSQTNLIKEHRKTKCDNKKKAILKELRKVRYLLLIQDSEEFNQILPIMSNINDITESGKFIFKKNEDFESIADYLNSVSQVEGKGLGGLGAVDFKNKFGESQLKTIKTQKEAILEYLDLGIINHKESQFILNEIAELINEGENGLISINGLSGLSGFFSKIKKGISKAGSFLASKTKAAALAAKALAARTKAAAISTVKNPVKAVKNGIKEVGKAIVKYNPLSVIARNAYLGLLRLNFRGWGESYARGYANSSVLRKKGYSETDIKAIYNRKNGLDKLWKDLGGNTNSLRGAILASKKAKAQLNGLGEVTLAVGAAAIATATPIIAKVAKIMKKFKVVAEAASKAKGVVNSLKSFIPKGNTEPILLTPPNPTTQNVTNQSEQDFINNNLVNDTKTAKVDKDGNPAEKDNTILWVLLGLGVVGGGYMLSRN